jgi:murein L,D-transpeptidase YafK
MFWRYPMPVMRSQMAGMRRHIMRSTVRVAAVLAWALMLAPAMAVSPPAAKLSSGAVRQDPEQMLIMVYQDMARNNLRQALAKADALVDAYPNFHLGHLVRGDLLLMHVRPVNTFGAVADGHADKLKQLRAEAVARLNALRERPNPALVPRAVLQLRSDQKHILLVDASRSRLYVYENRNGQPQFVRDYYISQGKLGIHKLKEGDQKTPVGVYYVTSRLPGPRLPDFYGPGALPINYPNDWDKLNGRGGSGIWLHGTPSSSYSRPPLSSDGCVVLTNPDLLAVADTVEVGKTPVLISPQIEYVSKDKWNTERTAAAQLIENWRRDLESMNPARLRGHYSSRFKSEQGEGVDAWLGRQRLPGRQSAKNRGAVAVSMNDISLFRYPGREQMIVATFTQEAVIGKSRHSVRKRQYWSREGVHWKIVAESNW